MKISEVYKKFGIPPNLQEHMLRVYEIVCFLEKHWTGESVDWKLVKRIAFLHDLGNVVRFNFDQHPEFLGEEEKNIEHWKTVQKEMIDKYGSDDHEATRKMLEEIGVGKEEIEIIEGKSFGNSVAVKDSDNWPLKILYYADLRTLPLGIGTVEQRLADVRERMPKYTSRPDFEDLVSASREIEKQIQQKLDIQVTDLNNDSIKLDQKAFNSFEL